MRQQVHRPPVLIERALVRALRSTPYSADIVGDLHEAYVNLGGRRTAAFARGWYAVQALRLIGRYAFRRRAAVSQASPGGNPMDRLTMEIRFALRALRKRPALTAAAAITLALGLGANAAVFGIVDALIIHPYDMPGIDRVVMAVETTATGNARRESVAAANFLDWRRDLADTIDNLSALEWWDVNLSGTDAPERVLGFHVSTGFFAAMGVPPALGRGFVADDEVHGRDAVVVLSDRLWQRRFGGDPSIVGRPILVDGVPATVIGVAPRSFDFPMSAELWAPLTFDPATPPSRANRSLTVIGRLHDGRTLEDGRARIRVEAARLAHDHPRENGDRGATLFPVSRGMSDQATETIMVLWQAAAFFVLLIACANIANLQLARGSERSREIAVRLALGCSRARILRESLVESLVLAVASVPFALAVAWLFLTAIRLSMPARVARFVGGWNKLTLDAPLIAVTVALAVVAAMVCGLLPAVHAARGGPSEALKGDSRTGAGPGRQRLRRALVVAEIALVLPLLLAATLSVRSVSRFLTGWQGYDSSNLLIFRAVLPDARYATDDARRRFAEATLERLKAASGVAVVGAANILPSSDTDASRGFEVDGQPLADPAKPPRAAYRTVSEDFFAAMRLPLAAGRAFTTADHARSEPVAIVNRAFVQRYWPRGNAIGSRVRLMTPTAQTWMTVVGVCGDTIHDWFDGSNVPTLYRPLAQAPAGELMYAVRASGDPLGVVEPVRAAIAAVDATQPIFDVMPMRQMLSERTMGLQFIAGVMGTFAGLALVLAVLGLYAVMSYLVAQRVREIGVRIALGASSSDVTRLALGQAARLTAAGVGFGLLLALALGRAMEIGLLGVVSNDLLTPLVIAIVLGATGLVSSYLPARRAAAVDPMVALRTE